MTKEDLAVAQPVADETDETIEGTVPEQTKEERIKAQLKDAIVVDQEQIGALRLRLTVTVPKDLVDGRLNEEFLELKRDAIVPGFRKGHAPLKLVEKRFAPDVGEQIKTQLIANGYMAAIEKSELKPLGDPLFRVRVNEEHSNDNRESRSVETDKLLPLDKALDRIELPKDGPLTFSCELELKPQFELPNLQNIPVRKPKLSISDRDVEADVKRLCMSRATFQPVDSGPVAENDLIYADMKQWMNGELVASENNVEVFARDIRYRGILLIGLGAALVGKSIGETVSIEGVVPDDHEDKSLQGKVARFEFTPREIKRLRIPPVDDRLLSMMGCETEPELRDLVRSNLEATLEETLRKAMKNQIGEYLLTHTTLDIPQSLSQRQTDRAVARRMIELYEANTPQSEIDKAADEMRVQAQEQAVRDFKLFFILEKIAEDRSLDVTEEELNSAIAGIARRNNQRFDRVRDELAKGDQLTALFLFMRDQKVLDTLLDEAEITEVDGPETTSAT